MSEKEKTIYCGGGKKQNDSWLKLTVCVSDLPKEHIFEYNNKKYVKLNVNINDEVNEWGKDVSLSVDTWKPEEKKEDSKQEETDSLPF